MTELNTPTLLLSGLTLPLALSFLLIVLWSDRRKELNQFFGVFMLLVCFWNGGSFIYQALGLLDQVDPGLRNAAVLFVELGFAGSSVALYALTVVLVRSFALRFRWLTFASLLVIFVILGGSVLLSVLKKPVASELDAGRLGQADRRPT